MDQTQPFWACANRTWEYGPVAARGGKASKSSRFGSGRNFYRFRRIFLVDARSG
jgi:hypothetical protein